MYSELLKLEIFDLFYEAYSFSQGAPWIFVLNIALHAVLLKILLRGLLTLYATQMVHGEVKLTLKVAALYGKVTANQAHSIELPLDFIDARADIDHFGIVAPHWLAKSETFEHMVHELFLALHGDNVGLDHVKVETAGALRASLPVAFAEEVWRAVNFLGFIFKTNHAAQRVIIIVVTFNLFVAERLQIGGLLLLRKRWIELINARVAKVRLPLVMDAVLEIVAFTVLIVWISQR